MEEREWIARARGGDSEAFSVLVKSYQRPVFNLCYRMLNDQAEADDAAQESFLKAYRGLTRYDGSRPFGTWLLSIAAHHCIDQLRRKRFRWVSLDALGGLAAPSVQPEAALEEQELRSRLRQALMELQAADRAVVVLRYWHELSHNQIAEALSLSPSAVKSRLHRAKRRLAESYRSSSDANQAAGVPVGHNPKRGHRVEARRKAEASNEAVQV